MKKKDTKQMYALKYMNKVQMIHKHALENVFREIKILRSVEHTFLVNLWFTFHDREDIFMVLDLMLGEERQRDGVDGEERGGREGRGELRG